MIKDHGFPREGYLVGEPAVLSISSRRWLALIRPSATFSLGGEGVVQATRRDRRHRVFCSRAFARSAIGIAGRFPPRSAESWSPTRASLGPLPSRTMFK